MPRPRSRNKTFAIAVKNYGEAVITVFCSCSVFLIFLLCSKYFAQDFLLEQFFYNSSKSPPNCNTLIFFLKLQSVSQVFSGNNVLRDLVPFIQFKKR